MKVQVVIFPGTNCDHDIVHLYSRLLGASVSTVWYKETDLGSPDLVVLPGGFSFGDYLRCGAMAKVSPSEETVEIKVLGGLLCVETFSTMCAWMDIAPPLPPQSFDPTLRERVAMSLQQPERVILASGLAKAVAAAQVKRNSLVEAAAKTLEPLGITYERLLNMVNEDIAKDRAPGEKGT